MNRARAAAVAGLAGFAVMSLELTAVRLLAPHFGDSAYVWTNVIGVILVALAAGAWWGGRMADREHGAGRLFAIFMGAGILVAAVPLVASSLGTWLLPSDLPLDAAMPALVRGSLAASLILFAPAVLLLGCVTPILITVLAGTDGKVGRASGLVAASSTLGSLLGTFATTHLLVPELGSRLTVWLCALLLILCSLLSRPGPRLGSPPGKPAALLLLPIALSLLPAGPMRAALPGETLVAEMESSYQYLQVVQNQDTNLDSTITSLKINEGLDSFHSVAVKDSAYTGGLYYDYHAVVPFLAGDGTRPAPLRVLSLGDAAGSFNRLYAHAHPDCTMDAVELDAAVVRLGDEHFGGRTAPGTVYAGLDARVFVNHATNPYDVILVDAYEHQVYIPAHVASLEFFTAAQDLLAEGGVISINVGALEFDDPVVRGLALTLAHVFDQSWAYHIPYSRNFMVLARKNQPLDPSTLQNIRTSDPELQAILDRTAAPQPWRSFSGEQTGTLLTDDRPVLDELLDRSAYATGPTSPTPFTGDRDPTSVGTEARTFLAADNPHGALNTLSQAQTPTPYLRILAGDARWALGDLRGALTEYQLADTAVQGDLKQYLDTQMSACRQAVASRDRAASLATRNGWISAALAAALAGAALLALRR